jgi:Uncharacterized conserved protein (DUF2190)
MTQSILLTITMIAMSACPKLHFLGFDGTLCKDGQKAVGVIEAGADAGEAVPVNAMGMLLIKAGGPINIGAQVQSDGMGRAITLAAGVSNGFAVDSAVQAGDMIRIIRGI